MKTAPHVRRPQKNGGSSSGASTPNGELGGGSSNADTGATNAGGLGGAGPTFNINFHGDVVGTDPKSLSKYLVAAMAAEL